jgi:hypothetical protein
VRTALKAFGVVLIAFLGLLLWARSCATPPRDAELVDQFRRNKQAFEVLKQMLSEDTSIRQIARFGIATTSDPVARPVHEADFPEERYQEYLRVLEKAGAQQAIRDGHDLRFPVAGWGFAGRGWRIAITWRDVPPTNTIQSLDHFEKTNREWDHAYRPIEDGWYIWIIW